MKRSGAALAVLVLALAGACGDDDDAPRSASQTADSTAPASVGPVIELGDLPSGWEETPAETLENDSAGSCLNDLVGEGGPFDPAEERTSASAFAQSSLGAFLITAVAQPVDDSAEVLAHIEQLVLACEGQTDAAGFTTTIEVVAPPEAGDDAVAFHSTAANDRGAAISFLIASARAGDAVALAVEVVALGELDSELIGEVLQTMVDRAG